jgi:SAM-dependent methyltransferase
MTVSLLGDGIYFVAIAWEVYSLSDVPTALSVVGAAWTLPTVIFLLFAGAITDRFDRRRVLIIAGLVEAGAIAAVGSLVVVGELHLWMLLVLVAVYGAGEAFFHPAFEAIVPALLPPEELTSASALEHFVRPLAMQMIGPALGGALVAFAGTGVALLTDASTFCVAVGTLLLMRPRPAGAHPPRPLRAALDEVTEGFRFVRSNPWLWGTLAGASLSLPLFYGPYQVLLPYLVKNSLHVGGGTLGVIRAAGGIGAIAMAAGLAQRGLPRRCVTAMFLGWSLQSLLLAGYAAAHQAWLFSLIALAGGALLALGNIVWGTLMRTLVPNELLGRVASFDWLVSTALIPVSFAITGPISESIGVRTTLLGAGVLSSIALIALLVVPGLRDPEHELAALSHNEPGRTELPAPNARSAPVESTTHGQRFIRTTEDVLELLDELVDEKSGPWWDAFFADRSKASPFFGEAPDENLVEWAASGMLGTGRALELGCGNGRNAIFLAKQGFDVDAVDYSAKAIDWARESTRTAGASVRLLCRSLFDVDADARRYDLVYDSGCFHHLPPHRRGTYVELVERVLKPGGRYGLVCFRPEGGNGLTDREIYEQRRLGRGIGYDERQLRSLWDRAPFSLRALRQMHAHPPDGKWFGENVLWTLLTDRTRQN